MEVIQVHHLEIHILDKAMFQGRLLLHSSCVSLPTTMAWRWPPYVPINTTTWYTNQFQSPLIVGDFNQHLILPVFDDPFRVHGLQNHVDIPTHILGGSLDSNISKKVKCKPLQTIGSSGHTPVTQEHKLAAMTGDTNTDVEWLTHGLATDVTMPQMQSTRHGEGLSSIPLNSSLHREACTCMRETSQWVISCWKRDFQIHVRGTRSGLNNFSSPRCW